MEHHRSLPWVHYVLFIMLSVDYPCYADDTQLYIAVEPDSLFIRLRTRLNLWKYSSSQTGTKQRSKQHG